MLTDKMYQIRLFTLRRGSLHLQTVKIIKSYGSLSELKVKQSFVFCILKLTPENNLNCTKHRELNDHRLKVSPYDV